jgi:hypothetical protein
VNQRRIKMSGIYINGIYTLDADVVLRIAELEAEREQASQDYADLLKDYRAMRGQVKIGLSVYRQTGDISAIEAAL